MRTTALSAAVVLVLSFAGPTYAATFLVNSNAVDDDGSCDPAPDDCTLVEAIDAATANAGSDTITFDPLVFPLGDPATITPTVALPRITDPAGTIVDGSGAGVVIDGQNLGGTQEGLVIQSGAGLPLTSVGVLRIEIRNFTGDGLYVCAGQRPNCDAGLTKTRIEHVTAVDNDGTGIVVAGSPNNDTRITGAVAADNGTHGVEVTSDDDTTITKARIEGTTAEGNGFHGISVNANGDNVGTRMKDCDAHRNGSFGINLNAGDDLIKAQLTRVTATGNTSTGVQVNAGLNNTGSRLKNVTAAGNGSQGIHVNAGNDVTGAQLKDCRAVENDGQGFDVNGGSNNTGTKITKSLAAGNGNEGVFVSATAASEGASKATIVDVIASNNGSHGIRVNGSNCKLTKIIADANAGDGLRLVLSGNKASKVRANRNDGPGIRAGSSSVDNKITKCTAFGNNGDDLQDDNVACATNSWTKNDFLTANDPCIE